MSGSALVNGEENTRDQDRARAEIVVLALTVLLGATLLFLVEPLIAKMILPWFGGSAGVWIVCLLFFQTCLLAGYLYAHLLVKNLLPVWQWRLHAFLLAASLLFLPIIPSARWKPAGSEEPLLHILLLLSTTIGLPFLLLAATGPLIQSWLARKSKNDATYSVYRLYAVSNFGSLLGLLSYPVLIEPSLPTRMQGWLWSVLYGVFVLLSGITAWRYRASDRAQPSFAHASDSDAGGWGLRVFWLCLAAAPSALLLAITTHVLRNIAAIPLFWVVPLALYLLTLIICFDSPRWYWRPLWYGLFAGAFALLLYSLGNAFLYIDYGWQLSLYMSCFFVCCMVCHGELAALKPAPESLTAYYLIVAAGGALGGLAVAAIAPIVFDRDYDLAIAVLLVALCAYYAAWRRLPTTLTLRSRRIVLAVLIEVWIVLGVAMLLQLQNLDRANIYSARNFYGPLQVSLGTTPAPGGEFMQLLNGNIIHGREFTDKNRACEPLTYYAPDSGVGLALHQLGANGPLRVGVIGLGAGTIAGYARPGDAYRFYEINPLVREVATRTFHYLGCAENPTVAIGDARLSLERETPQQLDLLAVDAFTSDAIPVHLLTKESFALYWRHLKPNGVLAVHITNRYIDLEPIVALAAKENGKTARTVYLPIDESKSVNNSVWVLVTSNPSFFTPPLQSVSVAASVRPGLRAWTDDYSNLWQVLK